MTGANRRRIFGAMKSQRSHPLKSILVFALLVLLPFIVTAIYIAFLKGEQ